MGGTTNSNRTVWYYTLRVLGGGSTGRTPGKEPDQYSSSAAEEYQRQRWSKSRI